VSALVVGIERVVVAGSNEFGPFFWCGVFLGADFIWIDGGTTPGGVSVGEFHKKAVGRRVWREESWHVWVRVIQRRLSGIMLVV